MKNFKRARTAQQKDVRMAQITDAAIKLYGQMPYEKITLAGIAKQLCFTRANLYKYVTTKEEIFLLIIERDIKEWMRDIIDRFDEKTDIAVEEFAKVWAQTLYRHPRLIELMSILYSIIEKNVSTQKLADFKRGFVSEFGTVLEMLTKLLPQLSSEDASVFVQMQAYFAMGLYPATLESDVQKQAIEMSGIPYIQVDFVGMFTQFTVMTIQGLIS